MSEIEIIATFKVKTSNADKLQKLLSDMSAYIKANEPGTLRYHLNRATKGDVTTFILLETYKDKQALGVHGQSAAFKQFQKTLAAEKIVEETKLYFSKSVAGFSSRL